MSAFTDREVEFLTSDQRRLGRIATLGRDGTIHVTPVGFTLDANADTITVGGHDLAATKKYRDLQHNATVAIVIDDVLQPWTPRGIEIRGWAELSSDSEPHIVIHPARIIGWGLDSDTMHQRYTRNVAQGTDVSRPIDRLSPADRQVITELMHRLELAVDDRDVDGFADGFTLDAIYEGPFGVEHGRPAIRAMSAAHHRSGSMDGKRRMIGPIVIRDGFDRMHATAHTNWWVAVAAGSAGVYTTGRYVDDIRRDGDTWRIEHRRQTIDQTIDGAGRRRGRHGDASPTDEPRRG